MTSGEDKQRRKNFERVPLPYELRLTRRDHEILLAIVSHRCLTSEQISRKFFPPSAEHKLREWHIERRQAQELVRQKSADYLDQLTELLKWLLQVRKAQAEKSATSSIYEKLRGWLRRLETDDPQALAELEQYVNSMGQLSPAEWLLSALQHNLTPPAAFFARPNADRQRISRACTQRLRLLYDAGYMEKIEQATRLSFGRLPSVYFLSRQGRDYLAKLLDKKPHEVYRLELVHLSDTKLPHFIRSNDIRIAITLDAEQLGFEIVEWQDDLTLRRWHQRPSERVTVKFQGKEVTFGVVPDGYFWLRAGERHGHFWVECDLDTVVARYSQDGGKDWRRKVLGIGEYYKTRYNEAYPQAEKSLRVLVVTTTRTRLNLLRSVTQEAAPRGAHRYWFTTFDRLNSGSPLTDKIWERADLDGLHAIVEY